jgi:threonine/homoserine/homoserine lactone efflux protein
MIDLSVFLAFVATVTVLMLIPGPNVVLIVANSVAHGPRFGLLTVAGTSSAIALQPGLTGLGMAELPGGTVNLLDEDRGGWDAAAPTPQPRPR